METQTIFIYIYIYFPSLIGAFGLTYLSCEVPFNTWFAKKQNYIKQKQKKNKTNIKALIRLSSIIYYFCFILIIIPWRHSNCVLNHKPSACDSNVLLCARESLYVCELFLKWAALHALWIWFLFSFLRAVFFLLVMKFFVNWTVTFIFRSLSHVHSHTHIQDMTWVPDNETPRCHRCDAPFTPLARRVFSLGRCGPVVAHHCRRCGSRVCGGPMPGSGLCPPFEAWGVEEEGWRATPPLCRLRPALSRRHSN